ncbi:chemotaxis histidine kinase, partial [mine drainage metagenome]
DPVGEVTLTFRREGAEVLIEVADNGAGLNLAAIRTKAIEMNLVQPEQILTDDDLIQMIFRPGFSTAQTLTQTAGRGVGMDVVASEIRDLAGTVEVLTNPGHGTRIVIRLPFTLAISQALLVTSGLNQFAIPMHSIEGVGRLSRKEYNNLMQRENPAYLYGGHPYQVMTLGEALGRPHVEIAPDVETIS